MQFSPSLLAVTLLAFTTWSADAGYYRKRNFQRRFRIRFRNIAYLQPMSPFLVSVHNRRAEPIFRVGRVASEPMAILAEDGNAGPLQEMILDNPKGVDTKQVTINPFVNQTSGEPGPLFRGAENYVDVIVTVSPRFRLFSFVSMIINTNDGFVGATSVPLKHGLTFTVPAYDAGSEENNELCVSIPGPACPSDSGNERSFNGEGV